MLEAVLMGMSLIGVLGITYAYRGARLRRQIQERLAAALPAAEEPEEVRAPVRSLLRRYYWVPWLIGILVVLGLYLLGSLQPSFCVGVGVIVGLLGGQLEAQLAGRKVLRVETQLADVIDLMVGALRAGASLQSALEQAAGEVRAPLRPQLEEMLGRIRFGDDPQAVVRALLVRVPLESFRLFGAALSVHWEVGGSLAPTLATVGRTIRDRLDISRRVRSLTTEARASIVAVVFVTAFLGVIMWRADPVRMQEFLTTAIGGGLLTFVVLLQAVGIVWSASISRIKF